jgi:hypothetical protein
MGTILKLHILYSAFRKGEVRRKQKVKYTDYIYAFCLLLYLKTSSTSKKKASKKNHEMIISELGRMWNDAVLPLNLSGRTEENHINPV